MLVSTPIGNPDDLSPRAAAALRNATRILCEDTRVTRRLTAPLGIATPLTALHDHNEATLTETALRWLHAGETLVLVSDAGTPLVSDPGYRLVRAALAASLPVHAIPGPNAALTALTLSGLPPLPFLVLGFPPRAQGPRRRHFAQLREAETAGLSATLIWHEAPHRLAETLTDLADTFGPRPAAIARELTKRYEEIRRDTLDRLATHYASHEALGEITLVVGPAPETATDEHTLDRELRSALATLSVREAAETVARALGVPRRAAYARALAIREEDSKGGEPPPLDPGIP